MTDLTELSLDTIAGRQAPVVFAHLLEKVMENVADPNTDPEEVRSITLTFKFKPHKSRNEAAVKLQSKLKLASVEDYGGHVFMRHTKDGTVATTHDTQQEEITFDSETGEIIEPESIRAIK